MSFQEVLSTIRTWTTEEQRLLYDVLRHDLLPLEIDDELLAEIERRSDEFDKGKVTAIPWPEARARARREAGLDG
jgi:putative addiction module component (TIGR02574 family)